MNNYDKAAAAIVEFIKPGITEKDIKDKIKEQDIIVLDS